MVGSILADAALQDGAFETALVFGELGVGLGKDVDGRTTRSSLLSRDGRDSRFHGS